MNNAEKIFLWVNYLFIYHSLLLLSKGLLMTFVTIQIPQTDNVVAL